MKAKLLRAVLLLVLAGWFHASPAAAAIAKVQAAGTPSDGASSLTVTLASTTAGNTAVVVVVVVNGFTVNNGGVTDNATGGSSTYSFITAINNGGSRRVELWSTAAGGLKGNATSLTVNLSGTSQVVVEFMELSGVLLLGTNTTTTGGTSPLSISLTTQDPNNWVVAGFGNQGSSIFGSSAPTIIQHQDKTGTKPTGTQTAGAITTNTSASAGLVTNTVTNSTPLWEAAAVELRSACSTVADASYVATNAQNGQVTVYWSSPLPVLIVRKTSAFSTEVPTNGTTYTAGTTPGGSLGTATVAYVGSGVATSFTETIANGTLYYKVFAMNGACYSPGTVNTTPGVNASPAASPQTWSYAMAGGWMMRGGTAGTGTIYTSSNASEIVSLNTANGTQSWAPVSTQAQIQGWLGWIPISGGGAAALGGDQSGNVYSVNTATGATNWTVTLKTAVTPNQDADAVQAPVSAQLRAYSNTTFTTNVTDDLLFVATRNSSGTPLCGTASTNNKVFAIKASTGAVLWTFNQSCNQAAGVDYIIGQPWVDYARNYIYVASRAGASGTQPSLWVINTINGSLVTSLALGHLQTSPTLSNDGKTLYVADTSGNLYALDTTTLPGSLTKKWTSPAALGTAVTLVQDAPIAQCSTATSCTATFGVNIAAGHALIATFSSNHGGTLTSVTGGGVTWTQAINIQLGTQEQLYIYYGTSSSGGTNTVTINGTSDNWALEVSEWSGLANAATLDVTGSATDTAGSTIASSGNAVTANANDLLIAFETDFSGAAPAAGPTNSFTALHSGFLNQPHNPAYRIVSAGGTYNTTWTIGPVANPWAGVIAAFKAAGTGATIADTSFVWVDYTTAGRLYFSTADGNVWCLQDLGAGAPPSLTTPCSGWSAVKTAVPGPSTPLLLNKLFVGSWNGTLGQIYQLNPSTGAIEVGPSPAPKQVLIGDGTKQPGDVSTETGGEIFVGTSEGKIFKFPLTSGSL